MLGSKRSLSSPRNSPVQPTKPAALWQQEKGEAGVGLWSPVTWVCSWGTSMHLPPFVSPLLLASYIEPFLLLCYLAWINQSWCRSSHGLLRAQMILNVTTTLIHAARSSVSTCSSIKSTLTSAWITCVQGYKMDIIPLIEALLEALDIWFPLALTREG